MPVVKRSVRNLGAVVGLLVLVAGAFWFVPRVPEWIKGLRATNGAHTESDSAGEPPVTLVPGHEESLRVPADVARSLGITVEQAIAALPTQPLKLDGTLFLDTNSMVHVHSRFAGDVVEIGQMTPNGSESRSGESTSEAGRPLQFGDRVKAGQILAVVWSKELGEKKSELVECLSRLRLSKDKLIRLEGLLLKGAISERNVHDQAREVESDTISVARAERTLRSWRLTDREIDTIYSEAEKVHELKGPRAAESDAAWARVEVRSPINGTIVEKNVAAGDYISSELDIFKIADLTRMDVLARAYEEDLPALEKLPHDRRNWTILLKADPRAAPLEGRFDRIGNIIDPSQHTALVMGWADNSSGRLRVGQFVTVVIDLPTSPDEVAVPSGAIVEFDGESYVFTRSSDAKDEYTRHRVYPVRRMDDLVAIDCTPRPQPEGKDCRSEMLKAGDWVVTNGGVQLVAELIALQGAEKYKGTANKP